MKKTIVIATLILMALNSFFIPNGFSGKADIFTEYVTAAESASSSQSQVVLSDTSTVKKSSGKIEVKGKVMNTGKTGIVGGIVAIGYDADGKPVETKCDSAVLPSRSFLFFNVILDAGSVIKNIEIKPVGKVNAIKLISAANRLENGKIIVTGCVENGTSKGEYIGIVAIGYDEKNQPVETNSICELAMSGYSKSFKVVLDAGSRIKRVEVKAVGDANAIKLISGANRPENGKIIATGCVENGTSKGEYIGIVAIGYDEKNQPVETNSICELAMSGYSKSFKVVLDAGSQIKRVEVKAVGDANAIKLISGANRPENGKIIATGCVENGTSKGEYIGIVAIGYDEKNQPVETNCICELAMSGYSKSFKVVLDASSQIKRVEVKAVGDANDIKLISGANRPENGKIIATGCVENGTSKGEYIGIVAIGYDEKNQPVETNCISELAMSGYSKPFKVVLEAGSQIKRVEVKVIGKAMDIVMLSGAARTENGKIIASAAFENGTNASVSANVIFTGYDKNNNKVEEKNQKLRIPSCNYGQAAVTLVSPQISSIVITNDKTKNQLKINLGQ